MVDNRDEQLKKIKDEILTLESSPLYQERTQNGYLPVVGEGDLEAKIMLVGEAPGKNEAKTGLPFVGSAGKILDKLLESVGISRKDVYVTSVLKDRPPENRDPTPAEIAVYGPFLDRQIDIIQPKIIATLGKFSSEYVMNLFGLSDKIKPISQMHGQVFIVETSYGAVKLVPLYHPAASIYNQQLRPTLLEDFKILMQNI
ncbi:MAG: uracil-DNA glycosylase [Candidatus Pacebacteria bacterium]|nr:uracil-DNA glycosylase [Candidatus Paceibacterota bacterium]